MAELRWYVADRNNFLDCLHSIACVVRKHITDLVIFTEEILNGKLHFLCRGSPCVTPLSKKIPIKIILIWFICPKCVKNFFIPLHGKLLAIHGTISFNSFSIHSFFTMSFISFLCATNCTKK